MDQRISLITLGVADIGSARAFYEELGWSGQSPDGDVVFFQAGGHTWEVAHNPGWILEEDGSVRLQPEGTL